MEQRWPTLNGRVHTSVAHLDLHPARRPARNFRGRAEIRTTVKGRRRLSAACGRARRPPHARGPKSARIAAVAIGSGKGGSTVARRELTAALDTASKAATSWRPPRRRPVVCRSLMPTTRPRRAGGRGVVRCARERRGGSRSTCAARSREWGGAGGTHHERKDGPRARHARDPGAGDGRSRNR